MTRGVIGCHAQTCCSSLLFASVSNRTSPARAIGSEIVLSLLVMAAWIERVESDEPAPSLLTEGTRRRAARTLRHCQGGSWEAATMNASTSAVCGRERRA